MPQGGRTWRSRSFLLFHASEIWMSPLLAPAASSRVRSSSLVGSAAVVATGGGGGGGLGAAGGGAGGGGAAVGRPAVVPATAGAAAGLPVSGAAVGRPPGSGRDGAGRPPATTSASRTGLGATGLLAGLGALAGPLATSVGGSAAGPGCQTNSPFWAAADSVVPGNAEVSGASVVFTGGGV